MSWISVKESLPSKGTRVLVFRKTFILERIEIACLTDDQPEDNPFPEGAWAGDDEYFCHFKWVVHWMPLPEPPSVAEISPS